MGTKNTETVVERVTSYVKDMLGIPTETLPEVEPDHDHAPQETAAEVTAENAMRLNPNPYEIEELDAETFFPPVKNPTSVADADIVPSEATNTHSAKAPWN